MRKFKTLAVFGLLAVLLTGCSPAELGKYFPGGNESVAVQGEAITNVNIVREYAYEQLDSGYRALYRDIFTILNSMGEDIPLSDEAMKNIEEDDLEYVFSNVMADHPELFFVNGYLYTVYNRGTKTVSIEFSGQYNVDRDTAVRREKEIEASASRIVRGIDSRKSDYEKVKYVYETLIKDTDYAHDSEDNQNIYSVFVNHKSVCQGYAKATQYLLNQLGIPCTLILGNTNDGVGHAWNLVEIDGAYYFLDTTWGDASYQINGNSAASYPNINYDYLNVTTQEISKTHIANGKIKLPNCTATAANYFMMEGCSFDTVDTQRLASLFAENSVGSTREVSIKCTGASCFAEMKHHLIDNRAVFDYWDAHGSTISYAENEGQRTLTFWMTN